ncbi:MAG: rRNA maturation RNase YbeY [Treponema sp.]|jgi:probable rRNA maturation factor|nr:rRNA maturation RNase YbeY [Treponema sp.]
MNRVAISSDKQHKPLPGWSRSLKQYALKVLSCLGRDKWDLSILLCGDKTISALNSQYRGKDEATDVLSFSMGDGDLFPSGGAARRLVPGDIVISLDSLKENARSFGISEDEELRRLLIHGILHLDGMDHKTNRKTEAMLQVQERILAELAQEHIVGRNI